MCWIYLLPLGTLLLWVNTNAIPIDNGVQADPEIRCGENSLTVKFQTRNPFEGHVFVKGHYADQGCRMDETGKNEAQIVLPFSSCGTRRVRSANPRGVFITSVVIITFHPQFITKVDRAYAIQCFYMEAEKQVTADLEVSMLTTSFQTQTAPMPACKYEVLDNGPTGFPVKFAKIGDQVYHKWSCDTKSSETFCMTVHTCQVDDGTGTKIVLLDASGCAQDKYLLGNLEYLSDLSAGRESHVFKYADRPSLYFNCQISITVKDPGVQCARPQCAEPARGKRNIKFVESVSNSTSSTTTTNVDVVDVDSEPITVLDLDPRLDTAKLNSQDLDGRTSSQEKKEICMTFIGFSGFATFNVVLMIISITLFVAAIRKARKTVL